MTNEFVKWLIKKENANLSEKSIFKKTEWPPVDNPVTSHYSGVSKAYRKWLYKDCLQKIN